MFSRRQNEFGSKQCFVPFDMSLPYGIAYGNFTLHTKGRDRALSVFSKQETELIDISFH